jgi:hypothetical protein
MKKETFMPFRRFDSRQEAQQFVEILDKNRVVYELEEYSKNINPLILDSSKEIMIKLRQEDFEQANEFVLEDDDINGLDENYNLYSFTDEELIEIVVKPNEGGELDRTLAPKLLIKRGYDLNNLDIESKKKDYIEELAQSQEETPMLIIAGYFFAFWGGLLGLAIGLRLENMKTTLPNGEKVFTYTEKYREHGSGISILSVIMIIIYALLFIFV